MIRQINAFTTAITDIYCKAVASAATVAVTSARLFAAAVAATIQWGGKGIEVRVRGA